MKKTAFYETPQSHVVVLQTESAFLSSSAEDDKGMGIQNLTYEDIQWN